MCQVADRVVICSAQHTFTWHTITMWGILYVVIKVVFLHIYKWCSKFLWNLVCISAKCFLCSIMITHICLIFKNVLSVCIMFCIRNCLNENSFKTGQQATLYIRLNTTHSPTKKQVSHIYKKWMLDMSDDTLHLKQPRELELNTIIGDDSWENICSRCHKGIGSQLWKEFDWKVKMRFAQKISFQ